jgi:hypothetical protein
MLEADSEYPAFFRRDFFKSAAAPALSVMESIMPMSMASSPMLSNSSC